MPLCQPTLFLSDFSRTHGPGPHSDQTPGLGMLLSASANHKFFESIVLENQLTPSATAMPLCQPTLFLSDFSRTHGPGPHSAPGLGLLLSASADHKFLEGMSTESDHTCPNNFVPQNPCHTNP